MKKSIQIIGTIAAMGIMLASTYLLGTTRAEIVIEKQKVIETVEVIPDGYIALNECIPLSDIACYFIDEYNYSCFALKDVATQYNANNTRSYDDIMSHLQDETEERKENLVDMRSVVDFEVTGKGLQFYFEDGTGYYIEID